MLRKIFAAIKYALIRLKDILSFAVLTVREGLELLGGFLACGMKKLGGLIKPALDKAARLVKSVRQKASLFAELVKEKAADRRGSGSAKPVTGAQRVKKMMARQIALTGAAVLVVVVILFTMSAAWYTNIAKTGSLTFRTESWGFDSDKITLSDAVQAAYPGASGLIPLSIDNSTGSDAIKVSVAIQKTNLARELQQRIYFYSDETKTYSFPAEGEKTFADETVDRVYVGADAAEAYRYTIAAGDKLTISDDYASDVPLNWGWVYDVTGYYFRGKVTSTSYTVDEYIRPIEYDLETAVFDMDAEHTTTYGDLMTIGTQTPGRFIESFSAKDGFKGVITDSSANRLDCTMPSESARTKTFYMVDVDEQGYGVWAYLLDYSEVMAAIAYDSGLTDAVNFSATIRIGVVSANLSTAAYASALSDGSDIAAMLEDESNDVIQLQNDVSLTAPIVLSDESSGVIDLNNFSLTYTGDEAAYSLITAPSGAEVSLINGNITGNGKGASSISRTDTALVRAVGGSVRLSGIRASGFDCAVNIRDNEASGEVRTPSEIRITGCDLTGNNGGIVIFGDGTATAGDTRLIIQDSEIVGTRYIGLTGSGNSPAWGTDITVINSTIEGAWGGIFQPQGDSRMVIAEGSIIKGFTGICVKGGTVTIKDSEVIGTGTGSDVTPAGASGSGFKDTADAVYVEAVYDWNATVVLKGACKLSSASSYAYELFGKNGAGAGSIIIYYDEQAQYNGGAGIFNTNNIGTITEIGRPAATGD